MLKKYDFLRVTVEGHCDERGTVEYNLALGERRAKAAFDYLVSLGVPADRLKTVSYGKEVPVCSESTEACWQKNRRAKLDGDRQGEVAGPRFGGLPGSRPAPRSRQLTPLRALPSNPPLLRGAARGARDA